MLKQASTTFFFTSNGAFWFLPRNHSSLSIAVPLVATCSATDDDILPSLVRPWKGSTRSRFFQLKSHEVTYFCFDFCEVEKGRSRLKRGHNNVHISSQCQFFHSKLMQCHENVRQYASCFESPGIPSESSRILRILRYQGFPRDFRGFQGIPGDSKGFQGTPRDSRGSQGIPGDSKRF